jgi:hypothetical protein
MRKTVGRIVEVCRRDARTTITPRWLKACETGRSKWHGDIVVRASGLHISTTEL